MKDVAFTRYMVKFGKHLECVTWFQEGYLAAAKDFADKNPGLVIDTLGPKSEGLNPGYSKIVHNTREY